MGRSAGTAASLFARPVPASFFPVVFLGLPVVTQAPPQAAEQFAEVYGRASPTLHNQAEPRS